MWNQCLPRTNPSQSRHAQLAAVRRSVASLQWLWPVATVQMVADGPSLAISLLEMPQVRRLHEAVVRAHLHQRDHDQGIQEEALHEAIDGSRQDELDLGEIERRVQVNEKKAREHSTRGSVEQVDAGDTAQHSGNDRE